MALVREHVVARLALLQGKEAGAKAGAEAEAEAGAGAGTGTGAGTKADLAALREGLAQPGAQHMCDVRVRRPLLLVTVRVRARVSSSFDKPQAS